MSNLTSATRLSTTQASAFPICAFSDNNEVDEDCDSLFGGFEDDIVEEAHEGLALPLCPEVVYVDLSESQVVNAEDNDSENVQLDDELMNLHFGDGGDNAPATSVAFNLSFPSPQVGGFESNESQNIALATPQFNPVQSETSNSSPISAFSDQVDFNHSAYSIFDENDGTVEQAIEELTQNPVQSAPAPTTSPTGIDISATPVTDEDSQEFKWPTMPPTEEQDRDAYIEIVHYCVFELKIWDDDHPLCKQDLHKDGSVKRPINSFPLYRRVWDGTIRLQLEKEHPRKEITTGLVSKIVGAKWRSLSKYHESLYKQLADKHLEIFKARNPGYVFGGAGSRAKRGLPPKKSPGKASRSVRGTRRAESVSSNDSLINTGVQSVLVQNVPYEYLQPHWQQPQLGSPPYGYSLQMLTPQQAANLLTLGLMGQFQPQFQWQPQVQLPQFPA